MGFINFFIIVSFCLISIDLYEKRYKIRKGPNPVLTGKYAFTLWQIIKMFICGWLAHYIFVLLLDFIIKYY